MAKGQRKTRRARSKPSKKQGSVLTIPQLRKAFDHMDSVVEHLKKTSRHSLSDAVAQYREEWRKTFKRELTPADAAAYLKFRFGIKHTRSTRRSRFRGGALSPTIAGAPLDYSLRPGVTGVYGNFPTYQTQGLDRYYGSAISADCGKPNSFPADPSGASQAGGGLLDGLFRPLTSNTTPGVPYTSMMEFKGVPPFPTSDPTSLSPVRQMSSSYLTQTQTNNDITKM